jgi:tetraacyldisaccharide 4'-kinase
VKAGAASGFTGLLLSPLSWVYGAGVRLRNTSFNHGVLKAKEAGVPVISIGNLTAGGTGKTPLVEYLVEIFLARGKRVAVVSRGYGRASRGVYTVSTGGGAVVDAREGGDEPVQIATKFPAAIVIVGEKKREAVRRAVDECGAEVIVLDDGFQHRQLVRSADIVLIDARCDITKERLLPAGRRREPLSALRRADLVVLSRIGSRSAAVPWVPALHRFYNGPMVWSAMRHAGFVRAVDRTPVEPQSIAEARAFVFSGIADHDGFLNDVRAVGVSVAGDRRFVDHHPYTESDLESIESDARDAGASVKITTEKDLVRLLAVAALKERIVDPGTLYVLPVTVEILKGEEHLDALLTRVLTGRPC